MTEPPPPRSILSRLAAPQPGAAGRLSSSALVVTRLGGMIGLAYGVVATSRHVGDGAHLGLFALLVATLVGYLGCTDLTPLGRRTLPLALAVFAVGAGAVGAYSGIGIAFVAILAIVTGDRLANRLGLLTIGIALASTAVAAALLHASLELVGWAALAGVGGAMAGLNRRQYRMRAEQSEQLLRERERSEAEAAHAAALDERNRIAREMHDVLAHSLGALAVQLEALDALMADGQFERARALVATSRSLAVEGLDEARRAVHALRDAPLQLADRVAALAAGASAAFRLAGEEPPLPDDSSLALYRAAQEALSNARKHAPGAAVEIELAFAEDRARLTVVDEYRNGAVPPPPSTSPPGVGLLGMRERVEVLGGSVSAGPAGSGARGWRVQVDVPVRAGRNGDGGTTPW